LALPGAWEGFPWEGERTAKVGKKKVFAFLGSEGEPGDDYRISLKLPESAEQALVLACCEPTGYGLGRANWVTIWVGAPDCPPVEVLLDWVEESYRTIAPKTVDRAAAAERRALPPAARGAGGPAQPWGMAVPRRGRLPAIRRDHPAGKDDGRAAGDGGPGDRRGDRGRRDGVARRSRCAPRRRPDRALGGRALASLLAALGVWLLVSLRACWATQRPVGWSVTPARCTRRLPSSIWNSAARRS
jgi:predicted DNA-binding protein (MmcQ/YjbR family)